MGIALLAAKELSHRDRLTQEKSTHVRPFQGAGCRDVQRSVFLKS